MKTWQKLKSEPLLFQRYFVKEYIIRSIREFFQKRNYHELESPILASALPQEHYLNPLTVDLNTKISGIKKAYLIPSTERYNKLILVAGIGEHFVISKVFRNLEALGPNHSPEFTMCEWYHLSADYFVLMDDSEELIIYILKYLAENLFHKEFSSKLSYQNIEIDFTPKWNRLSVEQALRDYSQIELKDIQEVEKFREVARQKGYNITEQDDWEIIFELIFASEIETKLNPGKPTFVYDYPIQLCPLAKVNPDNNLVAERVELYISDKEIANGYTELTDGEEQERRFKIEQKERKHLGKEPITFDTELIEGLKSGLPEVAGMGMGIDRLAMIFANASSIDDINYFPASEVF